MAGNYYDQEFDPWVHSIKNIGTMIMQMPAIRAQAEERAGQDAERMRRAQLYDAQTRTQGAEMGYHQAQTRKADQETAGLKQDQDGEMQIAAGLRRLTANPQDTNAMADVFEGTGKGFRKNPKGTAEGIGALLGQLKTLGGAPAGQAAQLQDPKAVYSADQRLAGTKYGDDTRAATAAAAPVVLPDNANLVSKQGQPIAGGMQRLGIGQRLFSPSGEDNSMEPVAEGLPPAPKSTASDTARKQFIKAIMLKTRDPQRQKEAVDAYDAAAGTEGAPTGNASSSKRPTRAIAKQYVDQSGGDREKARQALKADGYDPSGYAD